MSDRHPQRRGLGRGLGSLIPTGPRPTPPEATTTDQSPAPGTTTLTRPLTADWIGVPLPGDPEGPAHEESAGAEEVTPAAVPESESGRAPGPDAADPSGPATEDLATGEQIAGAADDGNPVGQSGDAADDREAAEQSGDTAGDRETGEQSGDTAQDRNPAERSEGADEGGTADAAENSDAGEKSDAAASSTEVPAVDQAAHQAGDGVEVVTPAITTDAVPLHGEALDGITAAASADPVPVTEAPATAVFGRHSAATDASSSNGSTPAAGTIPDAGPTGPALQSVAGAYFAELPVESIRPNPRQPREVFDEEAMAELVQSVLEVGLLQPVVVRPAEDGAFELVMGERRWRACQEAGLDFIPAIVRQTGDDDLLRDALLENLHRAQLNALEEAAAYQQLLEDFGCTHDELASRIGRSRPQISNTIRLLKLSPAVQRRVAAGVLSAGHARALLGVEDPDLQNRLAGRVVAEGISVRALEEIVTVGDVGEPARAKRRARPTAPGVDDLAARLSDRLETRVKVDLGRRKGRITVEFASLPDLERIVGLIDPGHPTRTRQSNPD